MINVEIRSSHEILKAQVQGAAIDDGILKQITQMLKACGSRTLASGCKKESSVCTACLQRRLNQHGIGHVSTIHTVLLMPSMCTCGGDR